MLKGSNKLACTCIFTIQQFTNEKGYRNVLKEAKCIILGWMEILCDSNQTNP